ncbi:hypothetical protein A2706_02450 [Candidatus Peribacteria bacterium RIFCSPHIGHO2_01_FULL_51_35]|nr:MAG: hypothetical protein A2706_02450 [Candidatus Peribacteria bacterium RIFCSPHIGHO2_01_FULL_51_35]
MPEHLRNASDEESGLPINTLLLEIVFKRHKDIQAFCMAHKELGEGAVRNMKLLLKRKLSPFDTRGNYRGIAKQLCKATGYDPETLFPKELYVQSEPAEIPFASNPKGLKQKLASARVPEEPEIVALRKSENFHRDIDKILEPLTTRDGEILKDYFGLNEERERKSLELIAHEREISFVRARNIVVKGINELQRIAKNDLKKYVEEDDA